MTTTLGAGADVMVFGSPSHLRTGINGKRAHPHSTGIAARTSLYGDRVRTSHQMPREKALFYREL